MIKKLQKKMIAVSMLAITIVLAVIIGAINIANYSSVQNNANRLMAILADNGGKMPASQFERGKQNPALHAENGADKKPVPESGDKGKSKIGAFSAETPYETRYFTVALDENGNAVSADTGFIAAISESEAEALVQKLFATGKKQGFTGNYKYKFVQNNSGTLCIFLDCTRDLNSFYSFLISGVAIGAAGLLLVFVLVVLFSKAVVRPVAESYEKQRRFITDAGHELKTPLTVIEANTEVIEMENGESEWTQSTKNQVARLSNLTSQLIMLAKMDEALPKESKANFSLSDAVLQTAQPFEAVAVSSGKCLECNVESGIDIIGDKKAVCTLISVLLDNAMKYSSPGSRVIVSLKKTDKKKVLSVYNKTDFEIKKEDLPRLFDRFYRPDASRNSQTGGSGIGLSVAKAVADSHRAKILAESEDGKSLNIKVVFN